MAQVLLRVENHHKMLAEEFYNQLVKGQSVDVMLAAAGSFIKAHRLVLAISSPYFKELFVENPEDHPVVMLKDVELSELWLLLQFIYCGEVKLQQKDLTKFLKVGAMLQVKGLFTTEDKCPVEGKETLDINSENDNIPHCKAESISKTNFEVSPSVEQDVLPPKRPKTIDDSECSFNNSSLPSIKSKPDDDTEGRYGQNHLVKTRNFKGDLELLSEVTQIDTGVVSFELESTKVNHIIHFEKLYRSPEYSHLYLCYEYVHMRTTKILNGNFNDGSLNDLKLTIAIFYNIFEEQTSTHATRAPECRWSSSPMDKHNLRGLTSVLPVYWVIIGYLRRESWQPELSLTDRKLTVECSTTFYDWMTLRFYIEKDMYGVDSNGGYFRMAYGGKPDFFRCEFYNSVRKSSLLLQRRAALSDETRVILNLVLVFRETK
ncbi:Protein tramtrack, beta isoform [Eumeta japonica]|uniref:Protein tramtrack, beta isoform n=1 Tax=Eumeta variegata TaxID=151549 RepID=A0A4C1X2C9_EUMVA|nr:Protein tramtrack, beta isoform [Eumeta japonica]